jgi:hypothetical protein
MSFHVSPAPFATFASSQTQKVADAAASQAVTYNITGLARGITLASGSRITLPQVGNYALSFSAIGHHAQSNSAKWFNIFLKKNDNIVDNSSTIVGVAKGSPTTVVATFDITCTTPGDYYEVIMAGQDTNCEILATPAQAAVPSTSPAMPACPSIIVVAWQIN